MVFNRKEYMKEWYKANREKVLSQQKNYYSKNKETKLKKSKEWRDRNFDKHKNLQKSWYERNKEEYLPKVREYKLLHREHYKEVKRTYYTTARGKEVQFNYQQKRRQAKNSIVESFTRTEWIEKRDSFLGICPLCFKGVKILTLDYIYPISLACKDYLQTGIKRIYTINDIQPICKPCNSRKKDTI